MAVSKTSNDLIRQFLKTAQASEAQKSAALNKSALGDPGGYEGESTHPSAKGDDGTEPAREGARGAENTADVKRDEGAAAVDNTPEKKPTTGTMGEANAIGIGIDQSATGEDPKTEDNYEGGGHSDGQFEGDTSHPARTDNSSLDGEKYAEMPIEKLAQLMQEQGNALLASLSTAAFDTLNRAKKAEAEQRATPAAPAASPAPAADLDKEAAAQAGYELAQLVYEGMDKTAEQAVLLQSVEDTIKIAHARGDAVAQFLWAAAEEERKQADDATGGEGPSGSGSGDDGAHGGEEGGGTADNDPGLLSAMASEGDGGAGGGDGAELQQLEQLLQQLGITPEQLMEMLVGGGEGGAEGGMGGAETPPPEMGAGAPPAPGGMDQGTAAAQPAAVGPKMAKAAAANNQRPMPAKKAQLRNELVGYVTELASRSRR